MAKNIKEGLVEAVATFMSGGKTKDINESINILKNIMNEECDADIEDPALHRLMCDHIVQTASKLGAIQFKKPFMFRKGGINHMCYGLLGENLIYDNNCDGVLVDPVYTVYDTGMWEAQKMLDIFIPKLFGKKYIVRKP